MFFPKPKPNILSGYLSRRTSNISRRIVRPAEIDPDIRLQAALQSSDVRPVQDPPAEGFKEPLEVRPAEIGPAAEFRQRVQHAADAVEVDVRRRVHVEFLRQVGVDAEEFGSAAGPGGGGGLRFEG